MKDTYYPTYRGRVIRPAKQKPASRKDDLCPCYFDGHAERKRQAEKEIRFLATYERRQKANN